MTYIRALTVVWQRRIHYVPLCSGTKIPSLVPLARGVVISKSTNLLLTTDCSRWQSCLLVGISCSCSDRGILMPTHRRHRAEMCRGHTNSRGNSPPGSLRGSENTGSHRTADTWGCTRDTPYHRDRYVLRENTRGRHCSIHSIILSEFIKLRESRTCSYNIIGIDLCHRE